MRAGKKRGASKDGDDRMGKLIVHNLRLVVYRAKNSRTRAWAENLFQ